MVFCSYEIAWCWRRFRVYDSVSGRPSSQQEASRLLLQDLKVLPGQPELVIPPARPWSYTRALTQIDICGEASWRHPAPPDRVAQQLSTNNFKCLSPAFSLSGGTSTQPRVSSLPRGRGHSRGCLKHKQTPANKVNTLNCPCREVEDVLIWELSLFSFFLWEFQS